MKTYAGIDLHSINNYVGIIDKNNKRLYKKGLPNLMDDILTALSAFMGWIYSCVYSWE